MYALLALGLTAFLLCFITTPLCRNLFLWLNIVDHPDAERKLHSRPIPRIGGIPIAFSYAAALGLMLAFAPHKAQITVQHKSLLWSLLPAAAMIFSIGLVDDLIGLKPWQKLAGQFAAAVLAVSLGAHITLVSGLPVSAWITVPLSVLWLIGCTNAFNLIDGLDGLATGVGLFATLTTLLAALLQGNTGLAMATIPLAGCLLAFLRYNFNPASIFLGDSGSLTLGFLLGCFSLIWSQKSATLLGMVAPLMALALPLLDVALSIGRRFLRSEPIFKADRGHIHHRLLALGLKPRDAALVLYAVCGVAAVLSLLQSTADFQFRGLTVVLFCSLSWFGVNRLGYIEFSAARKTLSKHTFRRILRDEIYLQNLKQSLSDAETLDECWGAIRQALRDLEFSSVQMTVEGRSFTDFLDARSGKAPWQLTLSLGARGSLHLARSLEGKTPNLMMPVLHLIQETIESKQVTVLMPILVPAGAASGGPMPVYSELRSASHESGNPATPHELPALAYKKVKIFRR